MTEPHATENEPAVGPAKRRTRVGEQAARHNAKRREAYHNNPDRAERLRQKAREHKRHPTDKDPNLNVGRAAEFGSFRTVPGQGEVMTFTLDELAPMVQFHAQVVRRWLDQGQLPLPVTEAQPLEGDKSVGGRELVPVYTLPEAEVILEVMARHISEYRYFRLTHIDTIDALARGLKKVRKG